MINVELEEPETLEMIVYNMVEIIMYEGLSEQESFGLIASLERVGIETTVHREGKILTFEVESDESLQDILQEMGGMGLVEDIGQIRVITQMEPQWQRELNDQYTKH